MKLFETQRTDVSAAKPWRQASTESATEIRRFWGRAGIDDCSLVISYDEYTPDSHSFSSVVDYIARVAQLETELAALKAQQKRVRLWPLPKLKDQIASRAPRQDLVGAGWELIERLHTVIRDGGVACLPAPNIEADEECLNFSWFDLVEHKGLTFSLTGPSAEELILCRSGPDGYSEETTFSDASILASLSWICGA